MILYHSERKSFLWTIIWSIKRWFLHVKISLEKLFRILDILSESLIRVLFLLCSIILPTGCRAWGISEKLNFLLFTLSRYWEELRGGWMATRYTITGVVALESFKCIIDILPTNRDTTNTSNWKLQHNVVFN